MRRVGLEFVGRRGRCSGLTPGQGRGANPCSGPAYPRGRPVRLVGGQRAMEQPAHRHRLKQGGSHVVVVRWRGIAAPPHGNAWGGAAGTRRLYRIVSCRWVAAKLSAVLSGEPAGWAGRHAKRGVGGSGAQPLSRRPPQRRGKPHTTAGRSRRLSGRSRCAAPQGAMTSSRSVLGWPCVRPTRPRSPPAEHAAPPVQMLALTSMHSNASAGMYTC